MSNFSSADAFNFVIGKELTLGEWRLKINAQDTGTQTDSHPKPWLYRQYTHLSKQADCIDFIAYLNNRHMYRNIIRTEINWSLF